MTNLERLIEENIGLIHKVSNKYKGAIKYTSYEYNDLVQEAIIGFIKSYQTFDGTKGTKFTTYATKSMNNELMNAIRKNSNQIKFPEYFNYVWKVMDREDTTNVEMIHEMTNIPKANIIKAIDWKDRCIIGSTNEKVKSSKGSEIGELESMIEDDEDYSKILVDDFLNQLDERTRKIVTLRMEGCTCQEIGNHFGLSRKRISKILQNVSKRYEMLFS